MNKFLADLKFQASYYYKNLVAYLSDLGSALIGRTRKQVLFLDELIDTSLSSIVRLSQENAKLKKRIKVLEANTVKAEAKPSKKKASPKQGQ